eukprot:1049996-Lingulodinium_polyedra.AAC.1
MPTRIPRVPTAAARASEPPLVHWHVHDGQGEVSRSGPHRASCSRRSSTKAVSVPPEKSAGSSRRPRAALRTV